MGSPSYPKKQIFKNKIVVFLGFRPQNPSKLPRLVFSIQAKPGNADFHGSKSDFDKSRDFGIFDFGVLGFWSWDFGLFEVRGLDLKAITSKTSPPGGQHFQKRHPPGFQEQGGSGFPNTLANHLLLVLKSVFFLVCLP